MRYRFIIAVAVLGVALGSSPADESALGSLVADLDDDAFVVRQRAMVGLLKIGDAAVPVLEGLREDDSPERRARVAEILGELYRQRLERGFREIGNCADGELEVERGMVLIAQILDPQVTVEAVSARLDEMAESVRRALGDGVDPKALGGAEAVAAITSVLRDQYRLEGDEETYDHPDNSSIHRVLEQGDGLPIILSEIAVAVGGRLGVPLVGIGVPKRYMFMYDGSRAPEGKPRANIIVDAFGAWTVKEPEELGPKWMFDPLSTPVPSTPRETLSRILRNMGSDFLALGNQRRCAEMRHYEALVEAGAKADGQ